MTVPFPIPTPIREWLKNLVPSLIRTYVPVGVSLVAGYLASRWNIVINGQTQAAGILTLSGAILAVYYAVARLLEKRWPIFGWLLGLAKAPAYSPAPAPEPEPIVISSTDPHELAQLQGIALAPHVADELVRLRAMSAAPPKLAAAAKKAPTKKATKK